MAAHERFARRFRFLKLLRASLVAGALYDATLAGLLVAAAGPRARLLGIPLPAERLYAGILAILLAMLAILVLAAARDPRRYSAVIAVASGGRLAVGITLIAATSGRPDLDGLHPLAAMSLLFGAAHITFWWPVR